MIPKELRATEEDRILAKDVVNAFRRKFHINTIVKILGIPKASIYHISLMSYCEDRRGDTYTAKNQHVKDVIDWWNRTNGIIPD